MQSCKWDVPVQGKVGAFALTVCFAICGTLSGAENDAPVAGPGEHVIMAPPQPKVIWTPAQLALREAMARDRSYATDALQRDVNAHNPSFPVMDRSDMTQAKALAGWKRFLERDDATKEQQIFAWWRLGQIYCTCDPRRGEKPDYPKMVEAMKRVREISPGLVSRETMNSATMSSGMPGASAEYRAKILGDAFNWMAKLTEKEIEDSAARINQIGFVIDGRHFLGGPNYETVEQRKQFLQREVAFWRKHLAKKITNAIEWSEDPDAIGELLKAVEDTADPQDMKKWRKMHRELSAKILARKQ